MANHKSDQRTNQTAYPPVMNPAKDAHGTRRVAFFSFTTPAGGVAIDDTIELAVIPKGARKLGGYIAGEAMSSGGAAASGRIGIAGDDDKYLGDTSFDAAAQASFGNTIALGFGELAADDEVVILTVKTEAWAAAKKLYGAIEYAVD